MMSQWIYSQPQLIQLKALVESYLKKTFKSVVQRAKLPEELEEIVELPHKFQDSSDEKTEKLCSELNRLLQEVFKLVSSQTYSPSATYSPTYKIYDQFIDELENTSKLWSQRIEEVKLTAEKNQSTISPLFLRKRSIHQESQSVKDMLKKQSSNRENEFMGPHQLLMQGEGDDSSDDDEAGYRFNRKDSDDELSHQYYTGAQLAEIAVRGMGSAQTGRNKQRGSEVLRRTTSQLQTGQVERRGEGTRLYPQSFNKSLTGGLPIPPTPPRPIFHKIDPKAYEEHLARIERERLKKREGRKAPYQEKKKIAKGPRTTVLVRNIPSKLNEIVKLNQYFKQFGKIININVLEQKHSAIIKFNSMECAVKARDTKSVVLDCPEIEVLYEPYPRGVQGKKPEETKKSKPIDVSESKFEGQAIKRQKQLKIMKKEVQASKFSFLEKKTQEIQKLLRLLKEKEDTISQQDRNNILEAIESIKQKTPAQMKEASPKKDSRLIQPQIKRKPGKYLLRSIPEELRNYGKINTFLKVRMYDGQKLGGKIEVFKFKDMAAGVGELKISNYQEPKLMELLEENKIEVEECE